MRLRAPEHDGGAPVAGVVFAVVVAVNVAAGSAALEDRVEETRSALSRGFHAVAALVSRVGVALGPDRAAAPPAPPAACPPRTREAEVILAPCGVEIRCDTRRRHTRIVCRTPS